MFYRSGKVAIMLLVLYMLPEVATGQPDVLLRTSSNAAKEWVTEKNLLLKGFGVSVQVDVMAETVLSKGYTNKAAAFLIAADSYDNALTYAVGMDAARVLAAP